MSGKGDAPRPFSVGANQYADNFARTFGGKVTETVPCDACFGTGIEPPLNDLDGKVMNPNAVCLSCQGQAHVREDRVEWVHPEPSDTEMLDWIEKQGNGMEWVARQSQYGRGFRLHNSDYGEKAPRRDVRKVIATAMREGK